ncbi:MAG: hypothetical protein ABSE70_05155 [Candidatus Limnocylindrales bacterium]
MHERNEWIGPPRIGLGANGVGCPAPGAYRLDTVEKGRIDRCCEPGGTLLLIEPALVADGPAGIQGIGQDLSQPGLGEAQLIGQSGIAPGARGIHLERTADQVKLGTFPRLQELTLPHSREAKWWMAARITMELPLLLVALRYVPREAADVGGVRDCLEPF